MGRFFWRNSDRREHFTVSGRIRTETFAREVRREPVAHLEPALEFLRRAHNNIASQNSR
jgi:hypothetical protein